MSIKILAFGQSNIEGRYGPTQPTPEHAQTVRAWDWSTDQWVSAQLGVRPFKSVVNLSTPAHNIAYDFAHRLAAQCSVDVDVVLLASGGKKIEYFLPNSVLNNPSNNWGNTETDPDFGSSLSEEIFGASGDARLALTALGESYFDVVMCDQGAGNFSRSGETAATYAAKVAATVNELQARNFITATTPVLWAEINPFYSGAAEHSAALASLANARFKVVPWAGVEDVRCVTGVNNLHATGRGLAELGERFLSAYFRAKIGV